MVKDKEELQTKTQTPPKASPKTNPSFLESAALISSLLALLLSAYVLFTTIKTKPDFAMGTYTQDLTKAQEKLDTTNQQIITTQKELKDKLALLGQQVQSSINQPQDLKVNFDKHWPLFKAAYYLEAAQLNANWTKNLALSLSLLEQAQALLTPFNEPELITIKQAITADIATLKSSPLLDKKNLLTQLEKAQNLIDTLTKTPSKTTLAPTNSETLPAWRVQLQDSLKSLEKLVVIRQNEGAAKPLLSPFLIPLVKESLHLSLQQASWAVLNNEPYIFGFSINQALTTLNRSSTTPNEALINQLKALQATTFPEEKPIAVQALPLLNQWLTSDASRKTNP